MLKRIIKTSFLSAVLLFLFLVIPLSVYAEFNYGDRTYGSGNYNVGEVLASPGGSSSGGGGGGGAPVPVIVTPVPPAPTPNPTSTTTQVNIPVDIAGCLSGATFNTQTGARCTQSVIVPTVPTVPIDPVSNTVKPEVLPQIISKITSVSGSSDFSFAKNIQVGQTIVDTKVLQTTLNSLGFVVASSGSGAPGKETNYYGPATKKAVAAFQLKYKSAILTPLGLKAPTGIFGAATRAQLNRILGLK